jgi:hypothetical protein
MHVRSLPGITIGKTENRAMSKWFILLAATASITAFAPTTASQAQIAVDVPGVGVRIGEPPRRDRERGFEEREVRGTPKCRTVTVTEDTPSGSRSRTKQECD